jgi:hypothetical protein
MSNVDKTKSNTITFHEFKRMMESFHSKDTGSSKLTEDGSTRSLGGAGGASGGGGGKDGGEGKDGGLAGQSLSL